MNALENLCLDFLRSQALIQNDYIETVKKTSHHLKNRDFNLEYSYKQFGYPWRKKRPNSTNLIAVIPAEADVDLDRGLIPNNVKQKPQPFERNKSSNKEEKNRKKLSKAEIEAFYKRNSEAIERKNQISHAEYKEESPARKVLTEDEKLGFYSRNNNARYLFYMPDLFCHKNFLY